MKIEKGSQSRLENGMTAVKGHAYFHNPGSDPLRPLILGDLLDKAAAEWPDRIAVASVHEDLAITFKEARDKSNQLACGLMEMGMERGDRLGIMGTNSVHWYITALAAARIGLILVPLNPGFKEDELQFCLKKVSMKGVITDETFRNHRYYETFCNAIPQLKSLLPDRQIEDPEPGEIKFLVVHTDTKLSGAFRYKDLFKMGQNMGKLHEAAKKVESDDPFTIMFSSGTTGMAKPTVLTHFITGNNSYFTGKRLGLHKKHHTICLQPPLFHIFGLGLGIILSLNFSCTLVFPSSTFKAASTVEAIKKYNCSVIFGSPTMFVDLCDMIKENIKTDYGLKEISFDVAFAGGSPCSTALQENIKNILRVKDVMFGYGLSETGPVMVMHTENDTPEQRAATIGMVADHVELKVVDNNGRMVPFGKPGEVWFRSYATMLGYWNDEENTKGMITEARWVKSGDLFILHENGYGVVVGRLKDLIIRGGENIIPLEVETFLEMHPEVVQVQVYGVSDKRMGEEVAASIKLKPFSRVTEDILMHFCKGKVTPIYIYVIAADSSLQGTQVYHICQRFPHNLIRKNTEECSSRDDGEQPT